MKILNKISFSVFAILVPTSTLAACPGGNPPPCLITSIPSGSNKIVSFLKNIQGWMLGFAGALAILFIVIGGVKMITSSGNPKQLESAKKTLTYAIIGLVVILLFSVILNLIANDFIGSIFGGASPY